MFHERIIVSIIYSSLSNYSLIRILGKCSNVIKMSQYRYMFRTVCFTKRKLIYIWCHKSGRRLAWFMQKDIVISTSPEYSGHCILIFTLIAFTVGRNLFDHDSVTKYLQSALYTKYVKSSYDKVKSCINDSVDENDASNISSRRQWHKGINFPPQFSKKKGLLQWIVHDVQ